MRVLYFAPALTAGAPLPSAKSVGEAINHFATTTLIDAKEVFDFHGWHDLNDYHDDFAEAFDAILLCTPGMKSERKARFFEALRRYTQRPDARPVIGYYNDLDLNTQFALMQAGAVYIHRSHDHVGVLATCLQRAIAGTAPSISGPAPYEVGPVSIDFLYQRVSVGGVDARLTASQYEVLEYLARRKGRPCTKESMLVGLNKDEDTDPKLIDVHVCNLRNMLSAANPEHPEAGERILRTVWGRGYAMAKDQADYDAELTGKGGKVLSLPTRGGMGQPAKAVARPA